MSTTSQPGASDYTFNRLHESGDIGQVWLAPDVAAVREVALEELVGGGTDNTGMTAWRIEEAHITGQLQHLKIVPVYESTRPAEPGKRLLYTMSSSGKLPRQSGNTSKNVDPTKATP